MTESNEGEVTEMSEDRGVYRRLIRKVEPTVFYEDNYFDPEGADADTWRQLWVSEKVLILFFLLALWFQVWLLLPILFFPTSLVWIWKESISGKAGNGYSGLEAGDAAGIGCMGFMSAVASLIWFVLALI